LKLFPPLAVVLEWKEIDEAQTPELPEPSRARPAVGWGLVVHEGDRNAIRGVDMRSYSNYEMIRSKRPFRSLALYGPIPSDA